MTAVSIFPPLAFNDRYDVFNFIRWFFSGSEAVETQTNYIAVLSVMMCFFFTSAAYYFVRIIYRSSIVTLLSLIPFALAVKTATILPYGYVAASAAVNIIIFVLNARKEVVSASKPKGKAALMVYTDFTVAVILLALILP